MSLAGIETQLRMLVQKVDVLLGEAAKRRKRAEDRRRQLHEVKQKAADGKVHLPPFHVLKRRDPQVKEHREALVQGGLRFASHDDPEGFAAWFVYYWNSCIYLKKPITFSGGYYRVYVGDMRMGYGAFDLMGYHKKQRHKQHCVAWRWGRPSEPARGESKE